MFSKSLMLWLSGGLRRLCSSARAHGLFLNISLFRHLPGFHVSMRGRSCYHKVAHVTSQHARWRRRGLRSSSTRGSFICTVRSGVSFSDYLVGASTQRPPTAQKKKICFFRILCSFLEPNWPLFKKKKKQSENNHFTSSTAAWGACFLCGFQ